MPDVAAFLNKYKTHPGGSRTATDPMRDQTSPGSEHNTGPIDLSPASGVSPAQAYWFRQLGPYKGLLPMLRNLPFLKGANLEAILNDRDKLHAEMVSAHRLLTTLIEADHAAGIIASGSNSAESLPGRADSPTPGPHDVDRANQVGEINPIGDAVSDLHAEIS